MSDITLRFYCLYRSLRTLWFFCPFLQFSPYDNVEHVFWFSHAVWNNNGDCAYLVEKNSGKVIHSHQVAGRSAHLLNSPVLPLSPPRSIHRDSLIARSPFVRRVTRSRSQGLNIQVDDDGETIESEWRDMDENGFDDMRVDSESYHSSTSAPSEVEYDLDPTDIIVPPHPKAASMMSASMQVVVGDAPRDEDDDDLDIDAMEDSDVSTSSVPSLDGVCSVFQFVSICIFPIVVVFLWLSVVFSLHG